MQMLNALKKHKFIEGIIIAAAIGVLYFMLRNGSESEVHYTFTPLTKGSVESTISSSGTLNPVTEITVGTQVSGTIEKVLVDFNDKVRKGQIIAVLDSALLQMSVVNAQADSLKAEAQYDEARLTYDRSLQLSEKGLISASDFQTVKTTLKTAQAGSMNARISLHRAVQNLGYSIIRSPITGTVTARNIEAGQTVAAAFSTPTLFTIAQDLSKMEITASVDESDIGQIKDGQSARFTVQSYPSQTFGGVVKQVRLKPTTASNVVNYTVVISAENKENLLLPGMTATVVFVIEHKKDVLLVPNAALRFQPADKDIAAAEKRMKASPQQATDDSLRAVRSRAYPALEWKRVWYLDKEGLLTAASVQIGISDGTNTEIPGNQYPEGMNVIHGTEADAKTAPTAATPGGGPRGPMM
jgi:HlyD family secretion protein